MDTDNDNFSDSKSGTSSSQAVRALLGLRELVLGGELPPGSRISELWVADRLGVSRTPIRAALIRLQEEGLVEPIPSGGFAVRSFAESEISDAIELRGTIEDWLPAWPPNAASARAFSTPCATSSRRSTPH